LIRRLAAQSVQKTEVEEKKGFKHNCRTKAASSFKINENPRLAGWLTKTGTFHPVPQSH
jgi:ribosomal protein L24E